MPDFSKNDEIVLNIEKLVYEGAGLARIEGFPVFVDNVCPGDVVRAKIITLNKNYAKAQVCEIISESLHRVIPFCPVHNACGGCGWQFIEYDFQLVQKRKIVEETINKIVGREIEIFPVVPSPKIREFRSKVQYPVSQTKVSKRILAGYYKRGTHELVNIKYCPIQPAIIGKIAEFVKEKAQELKISAYNEKKHCGELRHLIFRYSTAKNECLIIFVVNDRVLSPKFSTLSKKVMAEFAHVRGCCINYNTAKSNVIMSDDTRCIAGDKYYFEKIGDVEYKISANSFFQVNIGTAKNILDAVKEIVKSRFTNSRILDAYSGVSSIGLYLKDYAKELVCVEESESASQDAMDNAALNKVDNCKILNGDAGEIFEKLIQNGESFDVTILDPPRKGCSAESREYAIQLTRKAIIYVSCNPSTLARDIKYFEQNGFKAQYIKPFDMFCHSYHIESLCLLLRTEE